MELYIPKGSHHIDLRYSNTYFSLGIVVTVAAFAVFLILNVKIKRKPVLIYKKSAISDKKNGELIFTCYLFLLRAQNAVKNFKIFLCAVFGFVQF